MKIISIDSSIAKIGWAVLNDTKSVGPEMLVGYGTIKIPSGDINFKTQIITKELVKIIQKYNPEKALIETAKPFTYGRSTRYGKPLNQKAMAKNNVAVGIITTVCQTRGMMTRHMSAQEWKGNQKKEITRWVVNATYDIKILKSHNDEADAIKMGQWFIEYERFMRLTNKGKHTNDQTNPKTKPM